MNEKAQEMYDNIPKDMQVGDAILALEDNLIQAKALRNKCGTSAKHNYNTHFAAVVALGTFILEQ